MLLQEGMGEERHETQQSSALSKVSLAVESVVASAPPQPELEVLLEPD